MARCAGRQGMPHALARLFWCQRVHLSVWTYPALPLAEMIHSAACWSTPALQRFLRQVCSRDGDNVLCGLLKYYATVTYLNLKGVAAGSSMGCLTCLCTAFPFTTTPPGSRTCPSSHGTDSIGSAAYVTAAPKALQSQHWADADSAARCRWCARPSRWATTTRG